MARGEEPVRLSATAAPAGPRRLGLLLAPRRAPGLASCRHVLELRAARRNVRLASLHAHLDGRTRYTVCAAMSLSRWMPALLVMFGCQSGSPNCPGFCSEDRPATFMLTCAPTDLTDVSVSGPCSVADSSPSTFLSSPTSTSLEIGSAGPGVCHVMLTFATGFTYSADVTFVSQTDPAPSGCPSCSPYITATQRTFAVNNPDATCLATGADAGGDSRADAGEGAAPDATRD